MAGKKKTTRARQRDMDNAMMEIGRLRDSLDEAYMHFNSTTDPDALDACIYEISALRSRWNTAYKHYKNRFG
ncbi:MAG: DUF2508 family protein [Clostridiales bacterium]|jgi:hypothetical protein|nr:DUF2508 family protein [Clostridiales bacterium]